MAWYGNFPPVQDDPSNFSFKKWFQDIYRMLRGETRVNNPSLTAATNLSEEYFYPVDCTSGAITVTLPLAANYNFKKYCIKKVDSSANAVTVGVSGSDNIDGASTTTLTAQYDSVIVVSNGITTWHKILTGGGGSGITFTGAVWLTMVGGGGGGKTATAAGSPGGGGGSGESVESLLIKVTAGGTYSYSIGTGGAANTDGGDTYFDIYYCRGGKAAPSGVGGAGGGNKGGAGGTTASPGNSGALGSPETAAYFGGAGGGGAGNGTTANGGKGGGSGGYLDGAAGGTAGGGNGGGGGGAATIYGIGGAGGAGGAGGSNAASTSYGAGGGGGGGAAGTGGTGAGGYILLCWVGGATAITSGSGTWTAPT